MKCPLNLWMSYTKGASKPSCFYLKAVYFVDISLNIGASSCCRHLSSFEAHGFCYENCPEMNCDRSRRFQCLWKTKFLHWARIIWAQIPSTSRIDQLFLLSSANLNLNASKNEWSVRKWKRFQCLCLGVHTSWRVFAICSPCVFFYLEEDEKRAQVLKEKAREGREEVTGLSSPALDTTYRGPLKH